MSSIRLHKLEVQNNKTEGGTGFPIEIELSDIKAITPANFIIVNDADEQDYEIFQVELNDGNGFFFEFDI